MSEKKKLCVMKEPDQVGAKGIQVSMNTFSIDNLTDKHLSKILQYLTIKERVKFEAVCKKWKEASKLSWRDTVNLDFSNVSFLKNHLNFSTLELDQSIVKKVLSRCGEHLTNLNVGNYCDLSILSIINDYCPNLITLSIGFKSYSDVEFPLRKMEKLKSIKVSGCYADYYDEFLQILPAEIEKMGFSQKCDSDLDIDHSIISLKDFKAIQSLEFEGYRFTEMPSLPTLRKLSLTCCLMQRNLLIGKFNNIEYLDLHDTYTLDEALIFYLTDNCKNLKYLDISGQETGERLSTESLQTLGKLKNLEKLFLNLIDYAVDDIVINQLNNNLRILECKFCDQVTDSSILKILKNCKNLERLAVPGTGVTIETLTLANAITIDGKKLELHIDLDILSHQQIYHRKYNTFLDVFTYVSYAEAPEHWDSDAEEFYNSDREDNEIFG